MTDNTKPEVYLRAEFKADDEAYNGITPIMSGKDFYDNYWLKFNDINKTMEIRVLVSTPNLLKLYLGDISLFDALEDAPLLEKMDLMTGESRHATVYDLAKAVDLPKKMHFSKKLNSKKLMF